MKKLLLYVCLLASVQTFISCKKTELNPSVTQEQIQNQTVQSSAQPAQSNRYVPVTDPSERTVYTERDPNEPCEPTEVTLIAGQTINAGTVTVSNDNDYIYVTYATTNGWVLTQTHLYVGDCALIPVNNPGNPLPGQFPYKSTHNNVTSYTYQIPISRIALENCGCIAAHAVVVKYNSSNQVIGSETAWGNGVRINLSGGNWGMKFDYCSCTPW
jgi:hypothetical protein